MVGRNSVDANLRMRSATAGTAPREGATGARLTYERVVSRAALVSLVGEFDIASRDALAQLIANVISDGPRYLIVDMTDVTFLDCGTIACLIRLRRDDHDFEVIFAGIHGVARRAIDVLGFNEFFTGTPTLQSALRKVRPPALPRGPGPMDQPVPA